MQERAPSWIAAKRFLPCLAKFANFIRVPTHRMRRRGVALAWLCRRDTSAGNCPAWSLHLHEQWYNYGQT